MSKAKTAVNAELSLWLIFLVLVAVTIYLADEYISIPEGWYPASWMNDFASWVDGVFYGLPGWAKSVTDPAQKPMDEWFASVVQWFNDTLPSPSQREVKRRFKEQGSSPVDPSMNVDNYVPSGTGEDNADVRAGA